MKRFTLALLGGAMALGAMAHRDVYFSVDMSSGNGWNHKSWSIKGGVLEHDEAGLPYIVATGDFTFKGQNAVAVVHDQRLQGETSMPNLEKVFLFTSATDYTDAAHVTPMVVVTDEMGEEYTFNFATLPNTYETKMVESTSVAGDLEYLSKIVNFTVYYLGVEEGEEIDLASVALGSEWTMPKVSSSRTVESITYTRGPADMTVPGTRTIETGVTYIQAEDFDEPWINNRTAYKTAAGTNSSRLYPSDYNVSIQTEGAAGFGDGSQYGAYLPNHGHVITNRWGGNDDLIDHQVSGSILHNWATPGVESDAYYGYKGKYNPGATDDNPEISLENAIDNWGVWAEYTFEAEEDCTIDISLRVAAYRSPVEACFTYQPFLYWGLDMANNGYYLEEPYADNNYFELFGYKYMVSLDDDVLRTAYDAAPIYGGDGNVYMGSILDPSKWTNTQVEENGVKVNSDYLPIWPDPFWSYKVLEAEQPSGIWGNGWSPYYKDDMLKKAYESGDCSKAMLDKYAHGDYINIPVKKGRHTIKVQNMGGNSWFDEMRIRANNGGAGVDGVLADGLENAYEGTPVYFDLQGRVVNNPTNGIYLVKRGSKVTKEVIK